MRKKARRHGGTEARRGGAGALDKYDLYERAVTSPAPLARFLNAVHGRGARILGEDFSGTAALSRAWVELDPKHRAVAVDQSREVVARLSEACAESPSAARVLIVHANVLRVGARCDILAATNFPICYWHTRGSLLTYLRHARTRLNARGVFVADLYGGSDAFKTGSKSVGLRHRGQRILYTWEQRTADPISCRVTNAIHFRIGARTIKNAFLYDWRLWSIPELTDAMREAGFRRIDVYDTLGEAVDHRGRLHIEPAGQLDDPHVVYLAARR